MPKEYSHSNRSEPPTPYATTSSAQRLKEWDLTPHSSSSSRRRPQHQSGRTPSGSTRLSTSGGGGGGGGGGGELVLKNDYKPVYSKYKQEILTEEEYISNLSEIIKRDFFPQLHDLDTRKEIIKGLSSRDENLVEESVRKMREICTPVANLSNNNARGRKRINDHDTPGRRTRFDSPSNFSAAADVTTPTTFDQTPFGTSFSETPPIFSQRQRQQQRQNPSSSSSPHINTSLSLDAFQSRYTSQDNSSFSTLLARDNELRREKTRWAWEAEKKANEVQIRGRKARERLVDVTRQMIEGGQGGGGGDGSVWLLEGGKAGKPGERQVLIGKGIQLQQDDRERGLLMVARDEKERLKITQTDEKLLMILDSDSSSEKDVKGKGKEKETKVVVVDDKAKQYVDWDRPAVEEDEMNKPIERKDLQISVETWPFKNRNSLMFPPDADTDPSDPPPHQRPTLDSNASTSSSSFNAPVLPMGEPKGIRYHATRLMELEKGGTEPGASQSGETPSPSRSRIDAAISGTPYPTNSTTSSTTTPRVNNFSFVSALPSPVAHRLPPAALQELMTWGSIEATPISLTRSNQQGGDSSVGPFRIEDTSKREELAFKLAKKAKKSLADSNHRRGGESGLAIDSRRGNASLRERVLEHNSSSSSTRGGGGGGSTPRTGDHLSPAARSLLSKTKPGRMLDRGLRGNQTVLSREERQREEEKRLERARLRAREVESQDRLKRERWTPSPAVSLGFDPDLEDQRFLPKHGRIG